MHLAIHTTIITRLFASQKSIDLSRDGFTWKRLRLKSMCEEQKKKMHTHISESEHGTRPNP
jgi:hypothetical protein